MSALQYYFVENGVLEHVIFNKYTLDNGIIKNAKGEQLRYTKNKDGYNRCSVIDDSGKTRNIQVGRAIASTFLGSPPTPAHTADHKNKNPGDDTPDNIRWLCKSGQRYNQDRSEISKTAFIVVRDGDEKTINEWVEHLKGYVNSYGREYTNGMIKQYARRKQHCFSYKKYLDLSGEVWKEIIGSKNTQGHWEISNMNRVKYATSHANIILSGERLGLQNGYPRININGKSWPCHIISFMTFFPEEYANKKPDEIVLHEDDDKLDFRPHKLRLGTQSENMKDSYVNGKRDGTKTERVRCVSYINDVLEKEHASQDDAVKYLKSCGYERATHSAISMALNEIRKTAYDRTWKKLRSLSN